MSFADFGLPVKIMDATQEALDRGMQRIRDNYATSVRRGSLAEDEMQRRLARIEPVAGYEDIADCDLVIEAVFEEMDVKKPVFARLDEVMKPGALLFSNTSALDIDQLATMTKRPQDVAGTHFFSPANVMKLLEVVRGKASSPQTLATAMQMGRRIGKLSAMAGNTDGFVANRSRAPFNTEMVILLEEGCLPEQVDKVMVDFGYPMGPFAVGDLAGLDIGYASRKRRAAENPNFRKQPIADRSGGDGAPRAEDRRGMVSLREGRPHAASRSGGRRHHQGGRRRSRHAAARVHRPGDPAPAAVLLGERGVQDPGRRQGVPAERHRCDVAAWLRLPALSRRAVLLGRRHRRARGVQPDRRLASAIRRPLGTVAPVARSGRIRHAVPRSQGRGRSCHKEEASCPQSSKI